MAYKEWTITVINEYSAQLTCRSDLLPKEGYPDNDAYLAERNAAEADALVLNPDTSLTIGGQCTYNPSNPTYRYYVRRNTFHFANALNIMADAPIEYALFQFHKVSDASEIPQTVVITNGQPTYPHVPPVEADYNITNYSGNGGEVVEPTGFGWKEILLNATGRNWVDIDADYIFRLCLLTQDDIDSVEPTYDGNPFVKISHGAGLRPKLTIRVTLSTPTARTDEETEQGVSSAVFNGEITHPGYWLDSYGFEWKQGEDGDVTVVEVGTNRTTGLVFEYEKTGLSGTIYYRAYGTNGAGTGYGEWEEIVFASVTTYAATSVGVDHAKGNGTATGDDITERGFEIKLAFSGTLYAGILRLIAGFVGDLDLPIPGNVWTGTLIKTVSEEGDFEAGAFVGDLGMFPFAVLSDRLFAGETYDYRARATIDGTEYFGDWVEFTMATYPAGQYPDDQIPIDDIIPSEPPPILPEEPEPPYIDWPEYPPFEPPIVPWPDFPYPDIPPTDGSWISWFYYRKAYTKRDLDDLRRKCRIFQDNSVEYALVVNHNARVLQQFLNTMTDYMGADEHNTFRPIIPPQHLNALAREPLGVLDFKKMINNFISNSIDNTNNVNNNFRLIRDGLSDYTYTEDEGFIDISVTTRIINDNNPDVESLKKVIDRLNREAASNYRLVNHNLHVLRSILI